MKNVLLIISIALFSLNVNAQQKEKTYKVLAACGSCRFNMSSPNGCSLAIQLAGKTYWVDGTSLSDHGDEHATDGMCKTIRKAVVTGTIAENRMNCSSFALIEEKKKK